MKKVMNVIVTIAAVYIALVLLLYMIQGSLVFFPDRNVSLDPSSAGLEWEEAWFETSDGKTLHGWYIPHPDSNHILLFSHGNAGNISHRLSFIELLNERGLSIFIYDYRGYGKSEGRPAENGLYKDIHAAWNYLTIEKGYQNHQIILFGRSLGGPVSAHLAQEVNPGGVILESAFISAKHVASDAYPFVPSMLVRFGFSTIEYIQNSNSPLLIMHSRDDSIIPFYHGERLYESAPGPKYFTELRGGHNDNFIESGDLYFNELLKFVERLK